MAIINQIGGISIPSITDVAKGPLASLFGKSTQMYQYKYPMNLGNDPSRMHIVKFNFLKITPKQFDVKKGFDMLQGAGSTLGQKAADLKDTFSGDAKLAAAAKESLTKSASSTIQSAAAKAADVGKNLQVYLKPEMKKVTTSVSLYMPDTLAMSYRADYNELSLQDATNNMNRVAGAVGSVVDELIKGGVSKENTINALTTGVNKFGAEAALGLLDKMTGMKMTDLGLAAMGKAINPQVQLLFKGVGFRTFSMEFLFTPKSKEESDQVSAIVNSFVYASMPELETSTNGMYFLPPIPLEIQFLMAKTGDFGALGNMLAKAGNSIMQGVPFGNKFDKFNVSAGTENDRLFKVGRCVLEDVSVDYAPNGWASYENGAPLQTRMNLSFKEIDIIDRNRMKDGDVR